MNILQIALTVVLFYSLIALSIVLTIHLFNLWRDYRKLRGEQPEDEQ